MRRVLPWVGPAALAGLLELVARGDGGDGRLFVPAGRTLLSGGWSSTFSDPGVQVGPLQLALFGSVGRSQIVLAVLLGVAAALLVVGAARVVGVAEPVVLGAVGFVAVAVGFTLAGYASGHPADSLLPLIWVIAAVEARRGRVIGAGLLIGLAAGVETWAILGVASLALAPRWRDAARGLVTAATAATLLFLPFVVAGHFAMGQYHWQVSSHSLLALAVAPGTPVGWPFRLIQGAFAVAVGVIAARVARASPHAPWVFAFAVAAARLFLDPVNIDYYFASLEGPALIAAGLLVTCGLPIPWPMPRNRWIGRATHRAEPR